MLKIGGRVKVKQQYSEMYPNVGIISYITEYNCYVTFPEDFTVDVPFRQSDLIELWNLYTYKNLW